MIYMGPLDYWFWLGIEHGFKSKEHKSNPDDYFQGRLLQSSEVNTNCKNSYRDGFCIGEEVNLYEYEKFFEIYKEPEPIKCLTGDVSAGDIRNVTIRKDKITNIIGNC